MYPVKCLIVWHLIKPSSNCSFKYNFTGDIVNRIGAVIFNREKIIKEGFCSWVRINLQRLYSCF